MKLWGRGRPLGKNREGTAMVEFAIALPLLTLVVFGIMELGNAWHREQVVATAAREGVRLGAQYNPATNAASVAAAVQQYLDGARLDTTKFLISTNCCGVARYVTVTVTDTLKFPVTSRFSPLPATKVVNLTATMRDERVR